VALSQYDLQAARIGDRLTDLCAANVACAGLFRDGAFLQDALTDVTRAFVQRSGCAANPTFANATVPTNGPWLPGRALQLALFNSIFSSAGYYERLLVAPLVYRFQRCDEAKGDIAVWNRWMSMSGISNAPEDVKPWRNIWRHETERAPLGKSEGWSEPPMIAMMPGIFMMDAIMFNELWFRADGSEPSTAELTAMQRSPWSRGSSIQMKGDEALWSQHNLYYNAPERQASTSSTPLLILNGDMDGATTFPQIVALHSARQGHTTFFVPIPLVGHVSLEMMSPRSSMNAVANTTLARCPLSVVKDFLRNPTSRPDTSCVEDMPVTISAAHLLGSTDEMKRAGNTWFGTDDLYGGLSPPIPASSTKRRRLLFV
jgi:hypothetical protein